MTCPRRSTAILLLIAFLLQVGRLTPPAAAQESIDDSDGVDQTMVCSPLLTIDAPLPNAALSGAISLRGWALDLAQPSGSGVSQVSLFLDAPAENGGLALGNAQIGQSRPDVDAAFGRGHSNAGWQIAVPSGAVPPGPHTLYVGMDTACGRTYSSLPIIVALPLQITIDTPPPNAVLTAGQTVTVSGWAIDPNATSGSGIDSVHLYLDGQAGTGVDLGAASYGTLRSDVAAATGHPTWANSGYTFTWRVPALTAGPHLIYVYAHSPLSGSAFQTRPFIFSALLSPQQAPPGAVQPAPASPLPATGQPPNAILPSGGTVLAPNTAARYPRGSTGYTISWPQCSTNYPSQPYAFGIIGVEGGRSFTNNSCLAAEFTWARGAIGAPQLYINTNAPDSAASASSTALSGPAGACQSTDTLCQAYNYGYNNAVYAVSYARSAGASATLWWLDVETENSWSDNTAANARVVQGAADALRAQGFSVGVYSTAYQWNQIVGNYNPGVPLWTAGPQDAASAAAACTPASAFGGGQMALVSYFDGTYDRVYAC